MNQSAAIRWAREQSQLLHLNGAGPVPRLNLHEYDIHTPDAHHIEQAEASGSAGAGVTGNFEELHGPVLITGAFALGFHRLARVNLVNIVNVCGDEGRKPKTL